MRSMRSLSALLLLALWSACNPAPTTSIPPTYPPATPTFHATPTLAASLPEPGIVYTPAGDEAVVVGMLENQSPSSVSDLRLQIDLLDEAGAVLASQQGEPLLAMLPAGGASPYQVILPASPGAASARAQILSYRTADIEMLPLRVETAEELSPRGSSPSLVGYVTNPGSEPATVIGLAALARDESGRPSSAALASVGPQSLRPGERAPFLIVPAMAAAGQRYEFYAAAIAGPALEDPPVEVVTNEIRRDAQGNPFLLVIMENRSDLPLWASATLSLEQDGAQLAVVDASPASPIAPGEQRALTFWQSAAPPAALSIPAEGAESLQFILRLDPLGTRPVAGRVMDLRLELLRYESTGSRLILGGTITNPHDGRVERPALQATLRDTAGEVLTAGSLSLGEHLALGESASFLLLLPLPRDAEPAMAEYDLKAVGVIP